MDPRYIRFPPHTGESASVARYTVGTMTFGMDGQFMDPGAVVSHFHLREGERVGDFGAGAGFFLPALSKAIGASGRIYACEIQKQLVEKLGQVAREKHIGNVEVHWCDFEVLGGTKLADELLDAGLLANTLFQIENKSVALQEFARVIKKGGRLFVIDWSDSFGGLGPRPQDVVGEMAARAYLEKAGFSFERTIPAADHHYGIVMRKI